MPQPVAGHIPADPELARKLFEVIRYIEQRLKITLVPWNAIHLTRAWANISAVWGYPSGPEVDVWLAAYADGDCVYLQCDSGTSDDPNFGTISTVWWRLDGKLRRVEIEFILARYLDHAR